MPRWWQVLSGTASWRESLAAWSVAIGAVAAYSYYARQRKEGDAPGAPATFSAEELERWNKGVKMRNPGVPFGEPARPDASDRTRAS
jgi:hypothetical protein